MDDVTQTRETTKLPLEQALEIVEVARKAGHNVGLLYDPESSSRQYVLRLALQTCNQIVCVELHLTRS